jgi:hypothetical protein
MHELLYSSVQPIICPRANIAHMSELLMISEQDHRGRMPRLSQAGQAEAEYQLERCLTCVRMLNHLLGLTAGIIVPF